MRRIPLISLLCAVAVITACYRETGIEILPVTASQSTSENISTLGKGKDASARRGDYLIQNNQLQVVINGDLLGQSRDYYLPHSGGSIIDISTQYERGGDRTLTSRDDDALNQLSQGVNLNRNTPIGYERLRIDAPSASSARITLTGSVYDLDGSLAAAGAAVDSRKRVIGCTVTTVYSLTDSIEVSASDTTRPVYHLSMTTVVSNTGAAPLPIHDVNDMIFLTHEAVDTFIPYPEWGFSRPAESKVAWPHYLQIFQRQLNTTKYGMISQQDGLLKVRQEHVPSLGSDVLYVGKAVPPANLAAGGAITFMREFFAISSGTSGQSIISSDSFFRVMEELLVDTPDTANPFKKLGRVTFAMQVRSTDDRERVEGTAQLEYIGRVRYFDGTSYKLLEPGRHYPIFGDTPVSLGSIASPSYQVYLPGGQLAVRAKTVNSDEVFKSTRSVARLDQNGSPLVDENGDSLTVEEDILVNAQDGFGNSTVYAGSVFMGDVHRRFKFAADDDSVRDIYARVNIERVDSSAPVVTGLLPTDRQGSVYYIDQHNAVSSPLGGSLDLPTGVYDALVSRGPLNNVNIMRINNRDTKPTGSTDPQYDLNKDIQLGKALALPGYLSGDFDVRGASDPTGLVSEIQLMLLAYAEDIDALFIGNTNAQSTFKDLFIAHGRAAGGFSKADQDNKVESWFDEVAYTRALATIGKVAGSYPDRGRFSLLNLPEEQTGDYVEVPLMDADPASFYTKARKLGDKVIVHITRPRAPRGLETGFLTAIAEMSGLAAGQSIPGDNPFYTRAAEDGSGNRWIDFDMIQILAGNRYHEYLLARQDWFNMLNAGYFKPATGGSSAGQTKDLPIGAVRTYVAVDNTALRDNDLTEFFEKAKAGNSFVTNGPIIEATINGARYGQTTQVSGTTATAQIKLRAAPWVPIEELRVIVDGQVVFTQPITNNQTVRFEGTIGVPLPSDNQPHWVVFEAGASLARLASGQPMGGTFQRVMPGHLPCAFTNPIFVQ